MALSSSDKVPLKEVILFWISLALILTSMVLPPDYIVTFNVMLWTGLALMVAPYIIRNRMSKRLARQQTQK
jgi:hypothetical protein